MKTNKKKERRVGGRRRNSCDVFSVIFVKSKTDLNSNVKLNPLPVARDF